MENTKLNLKEIKTLKELAWSKFEEFNVENRIKAHPYYELYNKMDKIEILETNDYLSAIL